MTSHLKWIACGLLPLAFLHAREARAFNPMVHAEITKSALSYRESARDGGARPWSQAFRKERAFIRELLVRAAVDADYRPEIYLDTWFHKPFAGARSGNNSSVFTSMFHFLNVAVKGVFWDYDGYAFRHSTQQGFDGYLGLPGIAARGDLSVPLGGRNPGHHEHGVPVGVYDLGFKGDAAAWNKMFLSRGPVTDVVFPPADVVAQTAFRAMLSSPVAGKTGSESWNDRLVLATTVFKNTVQTRRYWRGEVEGLPAGFDLLGLAFHMAQDVSVPQHATGTADNCHQELEDLADRLACASGHNIDQRHFMDGTFGADDHDCQALYDPALVARILETVPELNPDVDLEIRRRIQAVALLAARWQWGDPADSIDFMGTTLPDGRSFSADRCSDLIVLEPVREQLKLQYNLAVAVSVALLEQAERDYAGHASLKTLSLGFDRGA